MRSALTFCLLFAASSLTAESERPNFVFFLVDDLGYMDIGAYNPDSFYETPNIDALAASGVRFTDGYAANPVCSPTRFSIMTGKYPTRFDATNFFVGTRGGRFHPAPLNDHMPLAEVTIAEALKEHGYRTCFAGKWHLGPDEKFWPENQGFDENFGGWRRGLPPSYFSPYENPRLEDGPEGEYLTDRLTEESLGWIEEDKDTPFLLYFSFYNVHTPLQAPEALVDKYREKRASLPKTGRPTFGDEEQVWPDAGERRVRQVQDHPTYAAMVESVDTAVGRVLGALEQWGLDENTVVIFMSDNGGLSTSEGSPTSNLPLRGGKGWLYEGGIREPFLIRWPGGVEPAVCDTPVISTDFYPTMLEIAGLPPRPDQHRDGVSLVPLLKGKESLAREYLYWHYPHYSNQGGFPGGAIRHGPWKLIERYEDGRVHLYHLEEDIGETNDVAEEHPDLVRSLREKLHQWYEQVDARFLQPKDGREPWRP